jgi:quercetin dioxygenase-like cupin family protein
MSTKDGGEVGGQPRALFLRFDEIEWDGSLGGGAQAALAAEARRAGARRKRVVTGQLGYFLNLSEMSAGFTVPTHLHDHDELIVVLAGGCTMLGGGPSLGPDDAMVIPANFHYGFTCGDEGMRFMTIRNGEAGFSLTSPDGSAEPSGSGEQAPAAQPR